MHALLSLALLSMSCSDYHAAPFVLRTKLSLSIDAQTEGRRLIPGPEKIM